MFVGMKLYAKSALGWIKEDVLKDLRCFSLKNRKIVNDTIAINWVAMILVNFEWRRRVVSDEQHVFANKSDSWERGKDF